LEKRGLQTITTVGADYATLHGLTFCYAQGRIMENLVDACFRLLMFTKHNDFPEPNTEQFFELTQLLDGVETAMVHGSFVDNQSFKKDAAKNRRTS
jgi:hypothetical protein